MRILVVNDTQEILELFREILSDEGHEVILDTYAIHDLDAVERAKPELIILDYIFGAEKLGWQFLQKLKMKRATAAIPVLICTGAVQQAHDMEAFLKSKNVQVLLKPFEVDDLLRAGERTARPELTSGGISKPPEEES